MVRRSRPECVNKDVRVEAQHELVIKKITNGACVVDVDTSVDPASLLRNWQFDRFLRPRVLDEHPAKCVLHNRGDRPTVLSGQHLRLRVQVIV